MLGLYIVLRTYSVVLSTSARPCSRAIIPRIGQSRPASALIGWAFHGSSFSSGNGGSSRACRVS